MLTHNKSKTGVPSAGRAHLFFVGRGPCAPPSAFPRGIAAVVGAKNMPPAYFLHAPTPHIGAATVEAQKRIGQEIVEIIAAM